MHGRNLFLYYLVSIMSGRVVVLREDVPLNRISFTIFLSYKSFKPFSTIKLYFQRYLCVPYNYMQVHHYVSIFIIRRLRMATIPHLPLWKIFVMEKHLNRTHFILYIKRLCKFFFISTNWSYVTLWGQRLRLIN